MRKIGLIFDSAAGYSIKEMNEKGHGYIPLQILINDEVRLPGVDLSLDELYENMQDKKNVNIKTSLPNGKDIEKAFDWALERYDRAIYIGISNKLSGTQNAIKNFINSDERYKNKIFVYDSLYSSPWIKFYMGEFEQIVEKYDDIDEIFKILDLVNDKMYGLVSPGDIYWFYKGGRISKTSYMLGSLLKVVPILTVHNGELLKDKVVKARGTIKSIEKMVEMVWDESRKLIEKGINFKIMFIESNIKELTEVSLKKITEKFKIKKEDLLTTPISIDQSAHMGPGSSGIGIWVSILDQIKGSNK